MKILLPILGVALLAFFSASAQVTVEVTQDQDQFLPNEAMPVAVRITNRSGQPLQLGASPDWLTFDVESDDGFIVVKNADVPVMGEFDLGSSQVATKRVDLKPYFGMTRPGRYRIIATLRIKDWGAEMPSPPKYFDVISGAKLWSQDFGVPVPAGLTNVAPEFRKYTLEEANYLRTQLQLYVEVSDTTEARVFNVIPIGKAVSFSDPDTQLDRYSNLHVLWQSGASYFTYAVVNPNGELVKQEIYDYVTARPRLNMADDGSVSVVGGVHRTKPEEMPMVKAPDELPASVKP
jgi:hypothetical protein